MIDKGAITGPVAKDVFEKMYGTGRRAADIVAAEGLGRIDDQDAIDRIVAERPRGACRDRRGISGRARRRRSGSSSAR